MRFYRGLVRAKEPLESTQCYPYGGVDLSGMDALVIAPHPDDESIGCGGSIVRHIRAGSRVKVIFLSDGQCGDFEGKFGEGYISARNASSFRALDMLGVRDNEFWGYRDGELWKDRHSIYRRLVSVLTEFKPDAVYGTSPFEPHPDHRTAAWACWRLWKKMKQRIAFYEVLAPLFPNIIADITDAAETKREAIACYETETSYNDYVGKTTGLNRYRTSTLSRESLYAEAFMLLDKEHMRKYKLPLRLLKTALRAIL